MKSIDGVNLIRVWSSVEVRKIATQKKSIPVRSTALASEPTLLSSREKNARLVFYAAIQPATKKNAPSRTTRRRSSNTNQPLTDNLGARMEQLLQADDSAQQTTVSDLNADPITHSLPLFNQTSELTRTDTNTQTSLAAVEQGKGLLRQVSKSVAKLPHTINDKASSTRSTIIRFLKHMNRKQHNA
jgi:hypothetical protein